MNMYDIILKKKLGKALSREEIEWLVNGSADGAIPDYQLSAFLMAVCFNSMTEEETADLTIAMARSGDMLDLSSLGGVTVDKHSTGGVGDKTTLVIAPTVAACGLLVPKMSGRGLGHTGGTIDKLEAIPGFSADLSFECFSEIISKTGCSIATQTGRLTPADKKLYALRDTTATVDSIPLIASSVMSKKLATGAECIVLDVKCGEGAFMKTLDDARALASLMVSAGTAAGRKCSAVISNMNRPLGRAVGNAPEVVEAMDVLNGFVDCGDFYTLCIELSAHMIHIGKNFPLEDCRTMAKHAISSGEAKKRFKEMIYLQGGNPEVLENYKLLPQPKTVCPVYADKDGYISNMKCSEIGRIAQLLGAGRAVKGQKVDSSAGIIFHKIEGEQVNKGDIIAELHTSYDCNIQEITDRFVNSYEIDIDTSENIAIILN